jgi:hypothetical protein
MQAEIACACWMISPSLSSPRPKTIGHGNLKPGPTDGGVNDAYDRSVTTLGTWLHAYLGDRWARRQLSSIAVKSTTIRPRPRSRWEKTWTLPGLYIDADTSRTHMHRFNQAKSWISRTFLAKPVIPASP